MIQCALLVLGSCYPLRVKGTFIPTVKGQGVLLDRKKAQLVMSHAAVAMNFGTKRAKIYDIVKVLVIFIIYSMYSI